MRLRGSPAAWERVFLNLFVNASQAMPDGGVVDVRASRTDSATEIVIADNGPGILAEILPRIFQPHFSTKSANSGLGLNIVESIVAANGGSVRAENCEGCRGARFLICLPDN
jgi:signal transduction histidine kinase